MLSKRDAIEIIDNLIAETNDDYGRRKLTEYKEKIQGIDELKFGEIAERSLGKDANGELLKKWIETRLQHELVGTEFIELNDMVSYNIAGSKADTIALHVVPKHVSTSDIRNMGAYLVDALEQLKKKIQDGEIQDVNSVFAVSDILKLKKLQQGFRELGFDVGKGEEAFRAHFKDPYQANLPVKTLLTDEWEKQKSEFAAKQPEVDVHAIKKMKDAEVRSTESKKMSDQDTDDDFDDR